jgi:hypothetical protein
MPKPIESDYVSHVAYCRELEEYCDMVVANYDDELVAVKQHWGNKFSAAVIERDALAQQVKDQTAEYANLLSANRYLISQHGEGLLDIKTITAERDSLKVDADRYQWLRTQNAHLESSITITLEDLDDDCVWIGSDLDAVVDSAMKAAS